MNWIDKAIGTHAEALKFRSQRSGVLAANIANANTPGYMARDYDFKTALNKEIRGQSVQLNQTNAKHIPLAGSSDFGNLMYRVPTKNMNDQNSVESEVEQAAFSENAVRYQTSLQFLNSSIKGLRLAIKGE